MISDTALQEARRSAERAVSDMPEGPMKIKAFEVILSRVLPPQIAEDVQASEGAAENRKRAPSRVHRSATRSTVPNTCSARIMSLLSEGFFSEPKGLGEIRTELGIHGWVYPLTSLSGTVQGLVQRRELRRSLVKDGKKSSYRYVNP